MHAPSQIQSIWQKFSDFPMETLTKAWFYKRDSRKKQRSVSLMKEHRDQYGITGNCFDLALWLLEEFKGEGIQAYPIGHHLNRSDAHVAVIALDENGFPYLCDLGDQWLQPVLIDSRHAAFTNEILSGFFPAAKIQVKAQEQEISVQYFRPNGKVSKQVYQTNPIEQEAFLQAAEFSQNLLKPRPLLECRIPYKEEIAHWEFYNWASFLSTTKGVIEEPKLDNIDAWVEKINEHTAYDRRFLEETLRIYKGLSSKLCF